ncbi:MAG: 30S ribosomal protein S20 [Bdellovibrionia bacterium]
MANTRTAAKRARQAVKRQARNQMVKSSTRSSLKAALDAIQSKDVAKAQLAYASAVKALSKAASKGAIPQGRAARKISRLTLLAKKTLPAALNA